MSPLRVVTLASLIAVSFVTQSAIADHHEESKQYIELRYYHLKSQDAAKEADAYLSNALVPALNRAGVKQVGLFKEQEEKEQPLRLLVIAHDKISDFATLNRRLGKDQKYQEDAASYMGHMKKTTPLARIRSELLYSFDCWPKLKRPALSEDDGRIFELRIYESSTEKYGDLKVEMFNSGEVPIFLDCGVLPVFMGQAVAGDKMPNLTYMTAYEDAEAKGKAWKNFVVHPDWKVLSKVEKYKGTVSKIHKIDLVPMAASQL